MDLKMKRCLHPAYRFETKATRLVDEGEQEAMVAPLGVKLELRGWCVDCGEPLKWTGMPKGYIHGGATVSADLLTARLSASVNPKDGCPHDCQDGIIYLLAGSPHAVLTRACPIHYKAPLESQ